MRKHRKALVAILTLPLVVIVGFLIIEHFQGAIALSSFKKHLAESGEILEIDKLHLPSQAGNENGFEKLSILGAKLKKEESGSLLDPPRMALLMPGIGSPGYLVDSWAEQNADWQKVAEFFDKNMGITEELVGALRKPVIQGYVDYAGGFKLPPERLSAPITLNKYLSTYLQLSLRKGNSDGALEALDGAVNTLRIYEGDKLAISELIRCTLSSRNFAVTWEALQGNLWTDGQLKRIQGAWEATVFTTNMTRSLEMERAMGNVLFEKCRISNEETYATLFPAAPGGTESASKWELKVPWLVKFFRKQVYCRLWRFAWLSRDQQFYLEGIQQILRDSRSGAEKIAVLPAGNWIGLQQTNFIGRWRFAMSSQSVSTLSRLPARALRSETEKSLVLCVVGIKRYQKRYGKLPNNLNALVPEILAEVPKDYMNGGFMHYRLKPDSSWSLYSVGDNGIDDGGDPALMDVDQKFKTIWKGKDVVWPESSQEATTGIDPVMSK